MKGLLVAAGVLLAMLGTTPARATDFVSVRAGFAGAALRGGARYAASAGASFEANIVPDLIGVRAAGEPRANIPYYIPQRGH